MSTTIDHPPAAAANQAAPGLSPPPVSVARADAAFERRPSPTWEDFRALQARVDGRANRRDAWTVFMFLFAAVAVLFGAIGIGLGSRAIDDANVKVADAQAHTVAPAAPALATSAGPVSLSDFKVGLGASAVAAGNVTVAISNSGSVQHELLVFKSDLAPSAYPTKDGNIDEEAAGITKVSDGDNLNPGATQSRAIDLSKPGTYLFVCNLPGHFKAGMFTVVTVK